MSEVKREKMWVYGENMAHLAIFKDEAESYYKKGWRDHPNKVGKPLEEVMPVEEAKSVEQAVEPVKEPKKAKGRK